MTVETLHYVQRAGIRLAARHRPGDGPTLVFLPGLRSNMNGDKATALAAHAGRRGRASLRLDYSGHGESGGRFTDGTIGIWRDDALAVIEALTPGPLVLVGSSMGGWIGLLLGMALGTRVHGFVGIAAAPDFTVAMEAELDAVQRATLARDGMVMLPTTPDPTPLTRQALDDGLACRVLDQPISLSCPVRLLHGQRDTVVDWQRALAIADAIEGGDCQTLLVKDGDHRLSRPQDVQLLIATVDGLG